jgi:hypothetical protein
MAKEPKNHRTQWTPQQDRELAKLIKENTPTRVIGLKLGRTEDAIYSHAGELGMSLKPTNRSPRTPRKR